MPLIARELDYTTPREVDLPEYEFPFEKNGDFTSTIVRRRYKQTRAAFTAARPVPGVAVSDSEVPGAYFMAMESPAPTPTGLVSFRRAFATVPADQITYGTRVITKPTAASVGGTVGTFQRLYASVALASIIGQGALYSGYLFMPNGRIYGPPVTSTSVNSGANTRITATAHGIAGTEQIIVNVDANGYGIVEAGSYTVVDANTIDVLGYNLGSSPGVTSIAKYFRDYTPGTDRVRIRNTQRFYLPGITAGIGSPSDIPVPDLLLNDINLLAAVLAYSSGYQTYDASELTRWNDWPIYTQTFQDIDMATL